MDSPAASVRVAPSRRLPSYAYVGIAIAVLSALVWLGLMPNEQAGERSLNALTVGLIFALLGLAVWSLWMAREHDLRVAAAEGERDQIFSLSLDLLCVLTIDGRFRRTNPAFLNVLGLKPDQLPDRSITDIVFPDDIHLALHHLKLLRRGYATSFEVRCICGDGTYKWMAWSVNPMPHEGLIYAVAHDITKSKATEDALRAETAFRKAMEESVSTGLMATDLKGRIIYVNRAFCEMTGAEPDHLIDKEPPFCYWPPEDIHTHWQSLAQSLSGKAPKEGFDMRILQSSGRRLDVRLHVSPLVDSSGVQTGWMSATTDITESKRARAELEAAHERFTAVLDGLDAAVFVADATTDEVLYANRAFLDSDGKQALDQAAHGLMVPTAQDGERSPVNLLQSNPLPREPFDGELQHPVSGRWFHLRERATRWVDGRVVRLAVATDITALKQVEAVNREQEARLARTSRLITMGEMASTLAHELNQPLSAIANYSKGCVNRIKSGDWRQEEILAVMEKANAQAARAGHIVRRVRDFVRKSEPKRNGVNLHDIAEDALGIAEIEAQRLGVRIQTEISEDLPPVFADRIMVEQVLLNLIKNGAEAEDKQPADRRIVRVSAVVKDGMVEVSVADYGHGISEKDRQHLFSAFFTTKAEGMGMGLNICRSIIEFHNGRLWVDPNPAGGSIFRFTLPLETSVEPEPVTS